jgi:hypothetical protein
LRERNSSGLQELPRKEITYVVRGMGSPIRIASSFIIPFMKTRFVISALFGLAVSASAYAQSFQSYDAIFGQPTPLPVGAPNFPVTLNLPEFDSNLGALDGATLTLTSTSDGTVSVINFTNVAQAFTNAFAKMTVDVTGPDGTSTSVLPVSTVTAGIANPGPFVISNFNPVGSTVSDSVNATNLSLYEAAGGGTLDFTVNSSAFGTYGGTGTPGAVGFGGSASASGDVMIQYAYTAIPEPSIYAAVVGFAALGLATIRRRRQLA